MERRQVLQACELLVEKEEFQLALEMLKQMECVEASWMKGKVSILSWLFVLVLSFYRLYIRVIFEV